VGSTGLGPKYGNRYINGFKATVNANQAQYEQVSALTGVPWEIVAAVALAGRFDGSQRFTLTQLATLFRQRAMAAGVDITRGMSPAQLDAAFQAYALGAKLKTNGLTPAQLAQLIKAPLKGAQAV